MTLHDKLKEIPVEFNTTETGRLVLSDSTIAAIIQAVEERLPGDHTENDFGYDSGWNAYREEVRKLLSEWTLDSGDGPKPVSVDRGSFTDTDSST